MKKYFYKKGFTLIELLVTVIIVATLATYAVYYYTNTIDDGKVQAAKAKLVALSGSLYRYVSENELENISEGISKVEISNIAKSGNCTESTNKTKLENVLYCGYVERNVVADDNFNFFIGPCSECGTAENEIVAYMKPKGKFAEKTKINCSYMNLESDLVVDLEKE